MIDPAQVPVRRIRWKASYRLIASHFPIVGPFDAVTAAEDLEAVLAVEAITDERARESFGEIHLVPPGQRVVGPGSTLVMAAFTHRNPLGSRFSAGQYGVYYAANSLETAVAEVSHHRSVFLARTNPPATELGTRLVTAELDASLHDVRNELESAPELYDPDHYGAAQDFGARIRDAGSWGVIYHSVRYQPGQCVALFRPRALRNAKATLYLALVWDGSRITHWYEKGAPSAVRVAP